MLAEKLMDARAKKSQAQACLVEKFGATSISGAIVRVMTSIEDAPEHDYNRSAQRHDSLHAMQEPYAVKKADQVGKR